MIANEEPHRLYQQLDTPGVYGGSLKSLQVFRGQHSTQWKDAHPGGCGRHGQVIKELHILPEYCFGCYKVQIEPVTVMELFKLLILFERIDLPDNNTRKCMVETRLDCSGTYKGLVYCRGGGEGHELHETIRNAVAKEISPHIPVTLKRGCHEHEIAYPGFAAVGPGAKPMEYNPDWKALENQFDEGRTYSKPMPAPLTICPPWEVFAMTFWLGYAATIGDTSYLEIAGAVFPPIPQLSDQAAKRRLHYENARQPS